MQFTIHYSLFNIYFSLFIIHHLLPTTMFRTNLKIAFRNITRHKAFSVINILGLSLGIAVFLLIAEYTVSEYSANRFHKNFDRLYRTNALYQKGNTDYYLAAGFAPMLADKFPGVERIVRVTNEIGGGVLSINPKDSGNKTEYAFREEQMIFVDPSFLSVFTFPLLSGSPVLPANTLAITQTIANKLYGNSNAVGKTITVSNQFGNLLYTVGAVIKDLPVTSDIQANVFLSLQTLENPANRDGNDWADPKGMDAGFTNIYFLLSKGVDATALANQITRFIHQSLPQTKDAQLALQPFKNLHIAPNFTYPFQTYGNLLLMVVFSIVGALILLIAWINYINLSTAQAIKRHKEVGVRKVLGASRFQLISQYLTETLLLTITGIAIGILMVQLMQPAYNTYTGRQLSLSVLNTGGFIAIGIAIILAGSVLSGGYVAFVISGYNPVSSIRGKIEKVATGISLRKSLVVFQFTISIVFIISTMILYKQMRYMNTQQLGMKLDQLIVIKGPTVSTDNQASKNIAFKNSLAQLPFITKYAASNNIPGQGFNFGANGIARQAAAAGDDKKAYQMFICDEGFIDTYGIALKEGKNFTAEDAANGWGKARRVIVNEKAAQQLGFAANENIVGKKIMWGEPYEVIGVVRDYHHLSLREAIQPTIYLPSVSFGYFTVQLNMQNFQSNINTLKKLYKENFGGNPFEFSLANEQFNKQYIAEQKLGGVFVSASLIAFLIAGMGLFGLATLSAQQRTKEIGIRKVLGANVAGIVSLVSKDFLKLVIIALVIASPIAWYIMNRWLENFAYKTAVSWWIFLLAGGTAVIIAFATVGYQSLRVARANPVYSLRQNS